MTELTPLQYQLIQQHFLFAKLSVEQLTALLDISSVQHFAHGKFIVRKGECSAHLMLLLNGEIRISNQSLDGKELYFNTLHAGDLLGEISLIDELPRSADAMALGDCAILQIKRQQFIALLMQTPEMSWSFMQLLCQKLRKASTLAEDIGLLPIKTRLARMILTQAEQQQRPLQAGRKLHFAWSQRELGNAIGATRESVNKQLRLWEDKQILQQGEGYLILLKPEQLRLEGE